MPKLLTSTSKSRSRLTHLYPRDFKPASEGEGKKKSRQKKRGRNWHNHHHPSRKSTPNPNPNPKQLQANEGVYCTLLSHSLSLSLALFPSPTSIVPIGTARQSVCRCRLINYAASPWYISSLSAFISLFLSFLFFCRFLSKFLWVLC